MIITAEISDFEDKNLQLLLKTLSNKSVQKSVESLSKINTDDWKAMDETATSLNEFVALGGNVAFFNAMETRLKSTIKLQIDDLLSPLSNSINQAVTAILNPFLGLLTPVINDLATFFAENAVGTGVGGLAGQLIGGFFGSPELGAFLGAVVGASIEEWLPHVGTAIESFLSPSETTPDVGQLFMNWHIQTGGTLEEYMAQYTPGIGGIGLGPTRRQQRFLFF